MGRMLTVVLVALTLTACGCDDDDEWDGNQGPENSNIEGWVEPAGTHFSVEGATVYLLPGYDRYEPHFEALDSTAADASGHFRLDGDWAGFFHVYAGLRGGSGPSGFACVSPFSSEFAAGDKRDLRLILPLHPVTAGSSAYGVTVCQATGLPTPDARVRLWRMEGGALAAVDSCLAAGDGSYHFESMCSGNYVVSAHADSVGLTGFRLSDWSRACFVGGPTAVTIDTLRLIDYCVRKPAVYIYPEREGRFSVRLDLGRGVRLTASEPPYGEGWDVFVETSGRIDSRYDYLFYELSLASAPRSTHGWCLSAAELPSGLAALLQRYGLNEREREAFLEYWRARLPARAFYGIYPICDDDLAPWVALDIAPPPDSVRRIWFVFRGMDEPQALAEPAIPPFRRRGTTVIEWGGMVLP